MRIGRKSLTLSITAALLVAAMAIGPVYAQGTLFVNPSSIIDVPPSLTEFTVTVEIDAGVLNLWGYEFKLLYNTAVLTATGYTLATEFPDVAKAEIDDAAGLCWFAASLPSFPPPIYGIDGPLALVTIDFLVEGTGESYLDIDEDYVLLVNLPGQVLDVTIVDGYFRNVVFIYGADLVGRSAWPEHHHFVMAKDGDQAVEDRHGTPGNQTLSAKVKNLGNRATVVYVVFTVTHQDDLWSEDFTTDLVDLAAGDTTVLTYDIDPDVDLMHGDPPHYLGKYSVEAQCYYTGEGDVTLPGEKLKSTGFSVVG